MSSPFPDLTPHCLRLFNTPHYQLFQVSPYDTYGITAAKVNHRTVRIQAQARTLLLEVIVHLDTPTAGRAALAELAPERATCAFAFDTLDVLLYTVARIFKDLRHRHHPELSPPPPLPAFPPPSHPAPSRCGG